MLDLEKVETCREIVRQIRNICFYKNQKVSEIRLLIDTIYQKHGAKRLFPTNITIGSFFSHCSPLNSDSIGENVTIDHGFQIGEIKVDTAFSTILSPVLKDRYKLFYNIYSRFISKLRKRLRVQELTNFDFSSIFDSYFSSYSSSISKDLMGHKIGKKLHEMPFLQPGLTEKNYTIPEAIIETNSLYAIEFYFTMGDFPNFYEVQDVDRSIFLLDDKYLKNDEISSRDKELSLIFYPLSSDKEVMQIEETFFLDNNRYLHCISSNL